MCFFSFFFKNLEYIGFFAYCEEMLERYENNEKVLWVCGTNYLSKQKMDKLCKKGKVGDYDAFCGNVL